jgi:5-methyltetrahydropteroyltriglutamate--homocysteine methyltransferase
MMLNGFWSPKHSPGAYPGGAFEMFADCVDIVRAEIEELVRLGCTYIQIDAPELSYCIDSRTRDWFATQGIDTNRMIDEGIDMLSAITGAPGVHFALHVCRGNNEGMFIAAGGYEAIATALFKRAKGYHSYILEYDDERSGDFSPLAQVPDDKRVVLGLVSTKTPRLEPLSELASRVADAARFIDRDRLALTSQCGFGTTVLSTPMTEQEQEAKLCLIGEAAHAIWR